MDVLALMLGAAWTAPAWPPSDSTGGLTPLPGYRIRCVIGSRIIASAWRPYGRASELDGPKSPVVKKGQRRSQSVDQDVRLIPWPGGDAKVLVV